MGSQRIEHDWVTFTTIQGKERQLDLKLVTWTPRDIFLRDSNSDFTRLMWGWNELLLYTKCSVQCLAHKSQFTRVVFKERVLSIRCRSKGKASINLIQMNFFWGVGEGRADTQCLLAMKILKSKVVIFSLLTSQFLIRTGPALKLKVRGKKQSQNTF